MSSSPVDLRLATRSPIAVAALNAALSDAAIASARRRFEPPADPRPLGSRVHHALVGAAAAIGVRKPRQALRARDMRRAAQAGDVDEVGRWLGKQVPPDAMGDRQETALQRALAAPVPTDGHAGTVELLLAHGADPNRPRRGDGNRPLHQVVQPFATGGQETPVRLEMARSLVQHGADPRAPNGAGQKPLELAPREETFARFSGARSALAHRPSSSQLASWRTEHDQAQAMRRLLVDAERAPRPAAFSAG